MIKPLAFIILPFSLITYSAVCWVSGAEMVVSIIFFIALVNFSLGGYLYTRDRKEEVGSLQIEVGEEGKLIYILQVNDDVLTLKNKTRLSFKVENLHEDESQSIHRL